MASKMAAGGSQWPITSEYNITMQEFTNLSYTTSEQHKDSTEEKMKRDAADLEEISSKLVYVHLSHQTLH